MPLKNYGVLVGRVMAVQEDAPDDTSPHLQIEFDAGGTRFRIAVNVMSSQKPPEVLYVIHDPFVHPLVNDLLKDLEPGFHPLKSRPASGALDFIRGNIVQREQMLPLPHIVKGPDNDLYEKVGGLMRRAQRDEGALVYAFGERWGPEEGTRDKYFGFEPGNGIHDIHMNQGNGVDYMSDNGTWQDGGLIVSFPATPRWVAVLIAFQSQCWQTDDAGHCAGDVLALGPVRLVAAMVNPSGDEAQREHIVVFNRSSEAVDLTGWIVVDRAGRRSPLSGKLASGATASLGLRQGGGTVQLSNQGGELTLLNAEGQKVHGVAYTRQQTKPEDWYVVFGS